MCNKVRHTFTGVPVLPEVVALSAVALVGAVDVGTLLTAWAGQTLIHIWRLVVRAHYCHNLLDQRISNVFFIPIINKIMLMIQLCFLLLCP